MTTFAFDPSPTWPPAAAPSTTLIRCGLLALLLHLLAVLVLGSAPGGSARPGEGVFGAINVSLRGPGDERGASPPLPAPPLSGPPGRSTQQRFGGVVRDKAPDELPPTPGARQLGEWAAKPSTTPTPTPTPPDAAPAERTLDPGLVGEARAAAPSAELRATGPLAIGPAETMPALPALPAPEALPAMSPAPPAVTPMPTPTPVPAPPTLARLPAPPTATPLPVPALRAAPAPVVSQALPPVAPLPAAPRSLPLPTLPPVAVPLPAPAAELPAAMSPLPAPPSAALPAQAVPAPPAPVPGITAEPSTATVTEAVEMPALAPPADAVVMPAPATARLPAEPRPLPSLSPSTPLQPMQPMQPSAQAARTAQTSHAPRSVSTPAPLPGAPDAGRQLGSRDVATAPAPSASAPKPLDLTLRGGRGGELSRHSTPGVLQLLPRPPESAKLADDIRKSARPDCRTAYSGAGLLAVVPLVRDAAGKDGCRW